MAQYGLRPPELVQTEQRYHVGKETHQLSLVPTDAKGQGHGWELLKWVHGVLQDFATHTGKQVKLRHVVANPKLVEKLQKQGFVEKPEEKEPGATIMVKTFLPEKKRLGPDRRKLMELMQQQNQ